MMLARLAIGLGEAAYGSVGLALIFSVFPRSLYSTLSGLYGGAAFLGSVVGLALGGNLAEALGWRGAFDAIAYAGFLLAAFFVLFVREGRLGQTQEARVSDLASLSRRAPSKPCSGSRRCFTPTSAARPSSSSPAPS